MTNVKQWWRDEYSYINRIAIESKNSQSAWFELSRRYLALSEAEKKNVNEILIEWIGGDDANKRSDALWLVRQHKVLTAKKAIEDLCSRLMGSKIPNDPQSYYEREEALEILNLLDVEKQLTN